MDQNTVKIEALEPPHSDFAHGAVPPTISKHLSQLEDISHSLEALAQQLGAYLEANGENGSLKAQIRAIRQVQEGLSNQLQYEAVLGALGRHLSRVSIDKLSKTILACLGVVGPLIGAERLTLLRLSSEGTILNAQDWCTPDLNCNHKKWQNISKNSKFRLNLQFLASGLSVAYPKKEFDKHHLDELAQELNVGAYMAWPVIVDGNLSAILMAERAMPIEAWAEESGHWMTLCTQLIGQGLSRESLNMDLNAERQRSELVLSSISDAVFTLDHQSRVVFMNPAAESLTLSSEGLGLFLGEVISMRSENTEDWDLDLQIKALTDGEVMERVLVQTAEGRELVMECYLTPLRSHGGALMGSVVALHDCTEAQELGRIVEYQSSHDALTGLLNRFAFESRAQELVLEAQKSGESQILVLLDLDGFKPVNDLAGHITGDALLRQVARVLRSHCRRSDVVGRLAGDEFGLLFQNCTVDAALRQAEAIVHGIAAIHIPMEDQAMHIGASVGLVQLGMGHQDVTGALLQADEACFRAKAEGGNRVVRFESQDKNGCKSRNWHAFLRRILDSGDRICLYAQPIAELSEAPTGPPRYELLLRLRDDDGSLLPPGAFLPHAERYHLMVDLDRRVLQKACEVYAGGVVDRSVCFNINLSGPTLGDAGFHAFCKEQLKFYDIPPGAFCFEVTETSAVMNLDEAVKFMHEMRAAGYAFALDDFGAGVSSFRYLKGLPIDCVKIDGAFVKDIVGNPISREIVRSINDISHVLGLKTVAEFVEDEAIKETLRDLAVDGIQGYLIARPRPVESILAELRQGQKENE